MHFEPLTRSILLELRHRGYNMLTAKSTETDHNPTWYPLSVPDISDYLLKLDYNLSIDALQQPQILVIEDALMHINDDQLEGEVFIEDNYHQGLQEKIQQYDKHYQFSSNPQQYNFSFDPQRILIRNHALHCGDHILYLRYLALHYPRHVIDEMCDLEDVTRSLLCLDTKQAQEWFMTNNIAVMQSDIWICDEDAILKIVATQEDDHIWSFTDDNEELMNNLMVPKGILSLRDIFWIDPRMK